MGEKRSGYPPPPPPPPHTPSIPAPNRHVEEIERLEVQLMQFAWHQNQPKAIKCQLGVLLVLLLPPDTHALYVKLFKLFLRATYFLCRFYFNQWSSTLSKSQWLSRVPHRSTRALVFSILVPYRRPGRDNQSGPSCQFPQLLWGLTLRLEDHWSVGGGGGGGRGRDGGGVFRAEMNVVIVPSVGGWWGQPRPL